MHIRDTLPPITLSTRDYNDLLFVIGFPRSARSRDIQFLARELRRAAVCHPDHLPDDVVALNSQVAFRSTASPRVRTCLLVHPRDLLCDATEISALTPLGTALLGLSVGATMPFLTAAGEAQEVKVEGIGMRFGAPASIDANWPSHDAPMPLRLPLYESRNGRSTVQRYKTGINT